MKKKAATTRGPDIDVDLLRRNARETTPTQRMEWLAAAVEFAAAKKTIRKETDDRS